MISKYSILKLCNIANSFIYVCKIDISDINECAADNCDQICVNDLGSYHCECYTGYFRDNNLSSCVG